MPEYSIRDRCHINTNLDSDSFVGVQCIGGDISINFPLGFHLAEDDKGLRKDILLLLRVLASSTEKMESELLSEALRFYGVDMPIQAYIYLISDFYANGIYKEREVRYQISNRGKPSWNRTLKSQKPYIQGNECFYLQFVTRKNQVSENELISQIHEYCLYESFRHIGWLFTASVPPKPALKFNRKIFSSVVQAKFNNTFNDRNKRLFQNMLAVINNSGDPDAHMNYRYGTDRFEYIWEKVIDRVYGIRGKERYFPRTFWHLSGTTYRNASLEPDTIMLYGGNIYVLDAKYYKFGATGNPGDLPESASVNKQITYGEYIAEQEIFRKIHGEDYAVYNAFIMPFDAGSPLWLSDHNLVKVGDATSSWKSNEKSYEHIQGILMDVKHLMEITAYQDKEEIERLAACIESTG